MQKSLKESYEFMFNLLNEYYQITHEDDVGSLLGELNTKFFNDGKPVDPAAWDDWRVAVSQVTNESKISESQTVKALVALLTEYNANHGFNFKEAIKYFSR
jgi:hypothetical protein